MHPFLHPTLLFPLHLLRPYLVSSSSSLELKPLFNTLKYAFLGPNETFSMIIANFFKPRPRDLSTRLIKGNPRGDRIDLMKH